MEIKGGGNTCCFEGDRPAKAQGCDERRSDSARRAPFHSPGAPSRPPPPFPSASGLLRAPGQSQCRAHVNHSPLANERPPFPRGDVRDASSASALSLLAVKTAPPAGGGKRPQLLRSCDALLAWRGGGWRGCTTYSPLCPLLRRGVVALVGGSCV